MSTLAERVSAALEARGMSGNALEAEAALSKGYVSRLTGGKRLAVSPAVLRRLSDALTVSYEWLALGRGAMELSSDAAPQSVAGGDVRYRAFDAAVAFYSEPPRWSPAAIAAGRAGVLDAVGRTPQDWAAALDKIEAALSGIDAPRSGHVEARPDERVAETAEELAENVERATDAAKRRRAAARRTQKRSNG